MRAQLRWSISLLAVGLLAASQPARSADDKPAAPPLERKAVDEIVNRTLRDVINRGATMYNDQGDYAGCYRLWEGALLMVRPFLDHRPGLQKAIDAGIVDAQRNPQLNRRAFVLREVMDKIRTETRGPGAPGSGATESGKTTLWERLGGEKNVTKVVDDLVAAAAEDKKVDFFRGGQVKLDAAGVAKLKRDLVDFISQNTGGPLPYKGPDMKAVHKGMGITDDEFNALAADLKDALTKNGAQPADAETLLKIVESTRKDIVEKKGGAAVPAGMEKLWDRLGGATGVARIVDAFVNEALKDKELNLFGDPDVKPTKVEIDALKRRLADFISSRTEGPNPYLGKGLPVGGAGKKITPAQFNAIVKHLEKALEEKKVPPEDAKPLLDAVEKTRAATVEEPKEKDKKPGEETVAGVVTVDGKPLAKGTIKFIPDAGDAVSGAIVDGNYKVTNLKPGKHKVVVESGDQKKEPVAAKFSDADKSPFQFEVAAKKQNVANFDVLSK